MKKPLEVSFDGPRPVYAPSVVEDHNRRGVWLVEYITPVSGTYKMTILADGAAIAGSPFEVSVQGVTREPAKGANLPVTQPEESIIPVPSLKPADNSSVSYTLHGSGVKEAVAGKPSRFEIHAKDSNGLLVPSRGREKIMVSFEGPRSVYVPAVNEDQTTRGVYKVEYTAPAAGIYKMNITVDSHSIEGSPFTVTVSGMERRGTVNMDDAASSKVAPTAATSNVAANGTQSSSPTSSTLEPQPSQSMERFKYEVSGAGISKGTARRANKFIVSAKDKQPRPLTDAQITATVESEQGASVPVEWDDTGKGAIIGSYIPQTSGTYKVSVTVGGCHIGKSPFSVVIKPGTPQSFSVFFFMQL